MNDRLQRRIFIRRDYEPATEIALRGFFQRAEEFIDVGANIGYFSLLAASVNPKLKVFSFEPLPKNMNQLKESVSVNRFDNITAVEQCVGAQLGSVDFLVPPPDECGWGRIAYKDLFNGQKINCRVTTLDHIESSFSEKTVIKMDVEGFERDVIHGGSKVIQKWKPLLCIEMNEPCFQDMGFTSQDLFDELHSWNYSLYKLQTNGDLELVEKPSLDYAEMNYIAIAKERTAQWL